MSTDRWKPSTPSTAEGAAVRDSTKKRIPAARKATQILLENFSSARTTGVEQSDDEEGGKASPGADSLHGKSLAKMVGIFVPLGCTGCRGKNAKNFWRSKAKI